MEKTKIVFATSNIGKVKEIKEILAPLGYDVLTMKEAGIDIEIVEDGKTFEENAIIKAKAVNNICHEIVMADDSGLEVDYLNKEPGVYSSRYEGVDTPYEIKNQIILDRLKDVEEEKRTARFVCAVAIVFADGRTEVCKDTIEGIIGYEPAGENGFGYDPIFYVPELGKSTAQLSPEEKNAISHRGKALRKASELLKK